METSVCESERKLYILTEKRQENQRRREGDKHTDHAHMNKLRKKLNTSVISAFGEVYVIWRDGSVVQCVFLSILEARFCVYFRSKRHTISCL